MQWHIASAIYGLGFQRWWRWWDMVMRCLSIDKRWQCIDKLHLALEHLPHIYRLPVGRRGKRGGAECEEGQGVASSVGNGEIQMAFGQLASGKWQMANGLHNCRLTDHFSPSSPSSQLFVSAKWRQWRPDATSHSPSHSPSPHPLCLPSICREMGKTETETHPLWGNYVRAANFKQSPTL